MENTFQCTVAELWVTSDIVTLAGSLGLGSTVLIQYNVQCTVTL